jgi:hypothetical protein
MSNVGITGKLILSGAILAGFLYVILAVMPAILSCRPIIVFLAGLFAGAFLCKVRPVGLFFGLILDSILKSIYGKRRGASRRL